MSTTPGPWKVIGRVVQSASGQDVAIWENRSTGFNFGTIEENEANARLIAAAPDLLAAAKHLRTQSRKHSMGCSWLCRNIQELFAAIAKAEGGDQ